MLGDEHECQHFACRLTAHVCAWMAGKQSVSQNLQGQTASKRRRTVASASSTSGVPGQIEGKSSNKFSVDRPFTWNTLETSPHFRALLVALQLRGS